MTPTLKYPLALLLFGSLLAACGDGGETSSSPTTTTTTTTPSTGGAGGEGGTTTTTTTTTEGGGGQGGAGGSEPVCGDGALAPSEGCDDGNTAPNDGCDAECQVENGFTCAGEPSDCFTICGDALLAGDEVCDDGNKESGDGCGATCAVEAGFQCAGKPSVCVTVCGDGILAGAEACDDGNAAAGDGCGAACLVEKGFTCAGEPSACATTCGDGLVAGAETCDDGGLTAGDGCDPACLVEKGYVCASEPSACVTVCGDGVVAGTEACDDQNTAAGDGCSAGCLVEDGYLCLSEPSVCGTVCGDGNVAGNEGCDDGNTAPGDGCSAACAIEPGYGCTGEPSACAIVCGNGIISAGEQCDDGNTLSGDGCSASCQKEAGWICASIPSMCATLCGDGIVVGGEGCDDGDVTPGDGCSATCTKESGWTCDGSPSACATICGDGIVVGAETCDDGNTNSGDGCTAQCAVATGETCVDPLVMSQAVQSGGGYTWNIPAGSVTTTDGDMACDPNTKGPDVVAAYTKTSDTLANGGQLLHVKADTPQSSAVGNFLNVEIKAGGCEAGSGTSLKCLWYKDNWDIYLDVPPGTYHIWVQKHSPVVSNTTFPDVTLIAEEVAPSSAEGEGCFAPYTSASSIYTPSMGPGLPHTWSIPPGINSFDMGPTWGEPGSISCDNTPPYGDIHGVDAVVQFDKQSATSVLKIDAQNLDPVLTQSALNLEVLSVCDPTSPSKVSRNCRANRDTISITAPSPAGPVYIWVSAEATGQELNGASLQVAEIFPGPGESWPTAQPLTGSGPINATSSQRLDAPSCFPASGNIHWFSYTLMNEAMSLLANAAGVVAIYDTAGQEIACLGSAATAPTGVFGSPGQTFYIAVQSPTPITSFTIADVTYTGNEGVATDLQITFPASPTVEYGMTMVGNQIVMGGTGALWTFPKAGNATAVQQTNGITVTHLGYDLVAVNANVFSVDSVTTVTSSRLFRVFDGLAWGPAAAWDITPTYPSTSHPSHAIATDGTTLFLSTRKTATPAEAYFYSFSPVGAASPTLLGLNTSVYYVVGMAVDNQYIYVASNGSAGEGVYRLSKSNVTQPAQKIMTIDTDTLCANVELDSFVNPQHLYVRDANGDVHALIAPASANPVPVGAISTLGTSSDYAMALDKTDGSIYLFETESDTNGRIVRLQ